jgi:hypothetical protein
MQRAYHGPSVIVSGTRSSASRDCQGNFYANLRHPPKAPVVLSPPIAAYVEATNSFNLEELLALFADDALVNDQLRDYWRKPAIREWVARDIIGQSVTMGMTTVIEHYGNLIVTVNVGGTI